MPRDANNTVGKEGPETLDFSVKKNTSTPRSRFFFLL